MKTYQWLLFDADGTLFDYDKAEADALAHTFALHGQAITPDMAESYREINHKIWQEFEQGLITAAALRAERFARLFQALDLEADPQAFSDDYLKQLARGTTLIEGAAELLAALAGRYQLALITNGLLDVQRPRLAASIIGHYFEAVIISDELGVSKPDPAIFDIAFARMGSPDREAVLIIGDSLTSDMQGGYNYGIDTCWYNPAGRSHDGAPPVKYEIRRLSDLIEILK